jgi:beta-galactosidase
VITVQGNDAQGRFIANAGNEGDFAIEGPGKIIGVGNGDPPATSQALNGRVENAVSLTAWRRSLSSQPNKPVK